MRKLLGLFAIFFFPVVQAEESDDANIMEEIVVTATYRDTNLMETPVSVSAVTDEMVRDSGAQSMEGLFTLIPGLTWLEEVAAARAKIAIRFAV